MNRFFSFLHGHFIPSHKNAYQPHFLRFRVVAKILGLVLVLEAMFLTFSLIIIPQSDHLAAIFASVLVDQTNNERIQGNLNGLNINDVLVKAAQMKADDMASKGYFSHNTPDGKTPWYWFDLAGYHYAAAGENLAVNFTDSKDVTLAWMHSETHRANIMNGNYTEIGIATARGVYKGKDAIFIVQEFGRPSVSVIAENAITPSDERVITVTPLGVKNPGLSIPSQIPVVTASVLSSATSSNQTSSASSVSQESFHDPVSSTTIVAGAEVTKLNTPVAPIDSPVLETTKVSSIDRLLASPRQTTTMIYFIIASILSLALGLTVFIKVRVQHPHVIANGVLLIAIILSLTLLNAALGFTQGVV